MVDFTTIQTYPIPKALNELAGHNNALSKSNNILKWVIGGMLLAGVIIAFYQINKYQNDEQKKSALI